MYESADVFGNVMITESCEIYGCANISESASVYDSARVYGDAVVRGAAEVFGYATIHGDARIKGTSEIGGTMNISGSATLQCVQLQDSEASGIYSDRDILYISGLGSVGRLTQAYRKYDGTIMVKCGCFTGDLKSFRTQVLLKYPATGDKAAFGREYIMLSNLIEEHFSNLD